VLVDAARSRSALLFEQAESAELASQETCQQVNFMLANGLIPQLDKNLPLFYLACGQAYDKANDPQSSFAFYERLLTEYPSHPLGVEAEAALLANAIACTKVNSLLEKSDIANRANFLSALYSSCGQRYD
jgi:hypothetical protein